MDRVRFGAAHIARAGRCHVGPWRHQCDRRGQRTFAFAQSQYRGEREISAGGISGKGDVTRLEPLAEHPAIGREHVVECCRKTMLRRQPIVEGEHAAAAGDRDLGRSGRGAR